jgi:hypothetical protein
MKKKAEILQEVKLLEMQLNSLSALKSKAENEHTFIYLKNEINIVEAKITALNWVVSNQKRPHCHE